MLSTATSIVQKLQDCGHEAYFAGGWVRDMILETESDDIDIATSATPKEVQNIFPKTFPVGVHFGVVLVREHHEDFEVATFRTDSTKTDGRRPESVQFSSTKQDAFRRDFTINGLFYNPTTKEIIDFVDGQRDIKRGILRFIGDPEKRIEEDFLRLFRAIRFKNRFHLAYEKQTRHAIQKHASAVFTISAERILQELNKMIVSPHRKKAFQDLDRFTILEHIIPEVTAMKNTDQPEDHHSEGNVFAHTLLALGNIPEDECLELYWSVFFHDIGKAFTATFDGTRWKYPNHEKVGVEKARNIMNTLKFPKKSREKICWIIGHEQIFDQFFTMKLSTRFSYYDHPYFEDLLKMHKYDVLGSVPKGEENKKSKQKRLEMIHQIEENLEYVHANKLLPSYKKELITGYEIMEILGEQSGKKIGILKKSLREKQILGAIHTKNEAIQFIKSSANLY